jgi:hypothetical protein
MGCPFDRFVECFYFDYFVFGFLGTESFEVDFSSTISFAQCVLFNVAHTVFALLSSSHSKIIIYSSWYSSTEPSAGTKRRSGAAMLVNNFTRLRSQVL